MALLVKLNAKPGKESEVEVFLRTALPLVQEEPDTIAWFAIRMGPSTFGIVDGVPRRLREAGPSLGQGGGGADGESTGAFRHAARDRESGGPRRQTSVSSSNSRRQLQDTLFREIQFRGVLADSTGHFRAPSPFSSEDSGEFLNNFSSLNPSN